MRQSDVQRMIDMITESIVSMKDNPEKYSEEYDAFYNVETNQWLESKCDDPTCEYCMSRPERPLGVEADYQRGIRKGADALKDEIDRELIETYRFKGQGLPKGTVEELREALEFAERKGWDIGKATKKINGLR